MHPVIVIAHMKGREAKYKDEVHAALWGSLQVHETAWITSVQSSAGWTMWSVEHWRADEADIPKDDYPAPIFILLCGFGASASVSFSTAVHV